MDDEEALALDIPAAPEIAQSIAAAELADQGQANLYEWSLDTLSRERLRLWVWCPQEPNKRVELNVYINKTFVRQLVADGYRQDLFVAGKGDGRHGLDIDFRTMTAPFQPEAGLNVEIVTVAPHRQLIASRQLAGGEFSLENLGEEKLSRLRQALEGVQLGIARKLSARSEDWRPPASSLTAERMCAPAELAGCHQTRREGDLVVSKYADYVRHRFKVDARFRVGDGKAEASHYFKWYLEAYCPMRGETRAPLASYEIDHLNELIILGGQTYHLSRATYMFLLDNTGLLAGMNLSAVESYLSIVYWWSIERARSLFVEDCLIPDTYRNLLVSSRSIWSKRSYPLSRFMEVYFSRHAAWHVLDLELEEDRILFYVGLMLIATESPVILEFLPRPWLRRITSSLSGSHSILAMVSERLFGDSPLSERTFDEIMRVNGFDLYICKSLSIAATRHRLHSASLPRPPASGDPRHVQVIGPMRLASGLGQAARLSGNALAQTSYRYSSHTFDLDNPAPSGYATDVEVGELVCPGVNLLHLNAESIPLAFAYLPDAFSEAYNIGYFFWELDTPASCHRLGVDLVDEIWVSSAYGAEIYSQYTDKPVVNVGLAIEEIGSPTRTEARRFLHMCTGIDPGDFTFLATFDSFSFIQRKNPQAVVRAFQRAFLDAPVRLVLKTHNRDFVEDPVQLRMWQQLHDDIASDPRIVLINETLSYSELILLKCGCDCYVSLHRSEGWGFGMAEAMNLGVPVIATGYSGNLEFCKPTTSWLVDYELKPLGPDDYIFVSPGQRWAEPSVQHAAEQMRAVLENTTGRETRTIAAQAFIRQNFSSLAVGARYAARLDEICKGRGARSAKAPRSRSRTAGLSQRASLGTTS